MDEDGSKGGKAGGQGKGKGSEGKGHSEREGGTAPTSRGAQGCTSTRTRYRSDTNTTESH